MKLSKTDFILYRECPKNIWVKWHLPDAYGKFELSEFEQALADIGNQVEAVARTMFPEGVLVQGRGHEAQEYTKKLMMEHTPVIFQAVFSTDHYLAATDVIQWNTEAQAYDLYEIKMSSTKTETESGEYDEDEEFGESDQKTNNKPKKTSKKELQYEFDLAFQTHVAELCGVIFNKKYLVRLNKKYERHGELDLSQLFIVEDKTTAIDEQTVEAIDMMATAYSYLTNDQEPKGHCECYYSKGRSKHCTAFNYINPDVPKYSVHDLNRIGSSKKLLQELIEEGFISMDDVPLDDRLKPKTKSKDPNKVSHPKKWNQVRVHKTQEPLVNIETLKAELDSLQFPLYFLDYETSPQAIPVFDGYRPYQQIVFQYSLHVLRDKYSEPEHYEELILDGDPSERIAESLKQHIGETGTVISWYKHFENSRNKELAKMLPEYADFFQDVISRTYDLMDIVEHQHYIHPGFMGRSSIKKVLPTLIPELQYKHLKVKSGTDAIEAYRQITEGELQGDAAMTKKREMLEYCKLDTYAMYALWKFFNGLVNGA